jgi:hypothetical protein
MDSSLIQLYLLFLVLFDRSFTQTDTISFLMHKIINLLITHKNNTKDCRISIYRGNLTKALKAGRWAAISYIQHPEQKKGT